MSNFDSNNPYYGGGGNGAGGFLPGGSPYGGSQDSPGGKKGGRSNQTLRPVTVKQVSEATQIHPDSDFAIDSVDVGQIILVGSVHNISTSPTNVSYVVGDGTGYIDVRQWLDSADDEAGKTTGITQDVYVSIIGTIKVFGGKRHVSASNIRKIENPDEVYHHLLLSLYVSLSLRNPSGGSGYTAPGIVSGSRDDYAAGGNNHSAAGGDWGHLPVLQRKIMEVVAREESEDGIHVSKVSREMGNTASGDDVMEAIETLMSDGMLFSTIDDLHIKVA